MGKFIDLCNQTFGDWLVLEYLGKSMWKCQNIKTKELKDIHGYQLKTKYSSTPINKHIPENNLIGRTFGEWTVLEYDGGGRWLCRCSCSKHTISRISTTDLINGKSTKCNNPVHKLKINFEGKIIKGWKVEYYSGNMRWHCRCTCGCNEEKDFLSKYLENEEIAYCKASNKINRHIIKKDITGQTFNNLLVLGYTGKDNMWKCKCLACGNENFITHRDSILTGKTKSCGCLKEKLRKETLMRKYGDTNTLKINNPREEWQVHVLESKENFLEYVSQFKDAQSTTSLAIKLGVNEDAILKFVHKYNIEDSICIRPTFSAKELELLDIVRNLTDCKVIHGDRKTLGNGTELDIYIPEKNLAIEFNGNYWHSEEQKDFYSHQRKTINCIKHNIRLIHIFEYEWDNSIKRQKLLRLIENALDYNITKINGRNTKVVQLQYKEVKEFLNENHLQNSTYSDINLGLTYNNELVGVMTFGTPRFNSNYQYELIRLAFKHNIRVIGGSEKLFKYFERTYNPKSIISYCDISKFSANVYFKLGFKTSAKDLTKPNYVWYNIKDNSILSRYQTQKHKLVKQGLDKFGNTEDEIMYNIGYIKISDSGNMVFNKHYENNT